MPIINKEKYEKIFADSFPFWSKLTTSQQSMLMRNTIANKYPQGAILHDGNQCTGAILVIKGSIRAYILSEEGREVTLYRLFPGKICMLSASCVLQSITFNVIVEAETDSECLIINGKTFADLSEENLYMQNFALSTAVERFCRVMFVLQQILFTSLDKRLAAFLIEESQHMKTLELKLTQEHIARNLSSAREVISRLLKYLSEEQAVKVTRGKIIITDIKKLQQIAD